MDVVSQGAAADEFPRGFPLSSSANFCTFLRMGWATGHILHLRTGRTVSFRPRGNSMSPQIESGQQCTVEPVNPADLRAGDIVLCKVRGTEYLHFVKAIQDGRFQIGNNRGHINGWIGPNSIFGRLVKVEP